jgi:uncharacterized membrane protein YhhN
VSISLWCALMAALVAALLVAHKRQLPWLEWICKPLASTVFVLTALSLGALNSSYGCAVLLALALSWLGDLLLIPKDKRIFLAGILAFLAGHLAFGGAFLVRGITPWAVALAALVLVGVGVPVGRWLVPQVTPSLQKAVVAYIVVLSGMVALAAGSFAAHGGAALLLGAVCFYLSDLSVALDRFVSPGFRNKVWGLPLYFGAQMLFAWTVARLRTAVKVGHSPSFSGDRDRLRQGDGNDPRGDLRLDR